MNTLPYSISSHLTSYLTAFRNLDGREENWPTVVQPHRVIPYSFYMKAAVAEVGFGLITVVALVETVVYTLFYTFFMAFFLPSLIIPTDAPRDFFAHKTLDFMQLSSIAYETVPWVVDNIFKNFKELNLSTQEPMTPTHQSILDDRQWSANFSAGITTFSAEITDFRQRLALQTQKLDAQIAQYRAQIAQYQAQSAQHRAQINALQAQNISPQVPTNIEMKADLKLLKTILERPENQAVIEDLKKEQTSEAFQLLSFLVIVECIFTDLDDLDFLCVSARQQVKSLQQDQDFKDKIESLKQTHPNLFTGNPLDFDQIEIDKLEEEEAQTVFREIKNISSLALQGSSLFGTVLAEYLEEPA